MTTTYLARVALDEIGRAQAELERHLAVRPDGSCATCGEVEPCAGRRAAGITFDRYGLLPRRRFGVAGVRASSPDPTDITPRSWFAVAGDTAEIWGDPAEPRFCDRQSPGTMQPSTTVEPAMAQQQTQPIFIGPKELRERLGGISAGQLSGITCRDDFPPPVAALRQGRVWLARDVDEWIAESGPDQPVA